MKVELFSYRNNPVYQYHLEIPTIIVTKQLRVSLLLAHPVLCILKAKEKRYSLYTARCTAAWDLWKWVGQCNL